MFTQCSKCETVFRLSAEALRAAGGQVRCGRCGEVFNALARLAEDASEFTKGESPLDLETRADEILEATDTHAALVDPDAVDDGIALHDPPPGVEIAQLQFLDPLSEDPSLEFTLPPGELDRIFVESPSNPLQTLTTGKQSGEWQHGDVSSELVPAGASPWDALLPVVLPVTPNSANAGPSTEGPATATPFTKGPRSTDAVTSGVLAPDLVATDAATADELAAGPAQDAAVPRTESSFTAPSPFNAGAVSSGSFTSASAMGPIAPPRNSVGESSARLAGLELSDREELPQLNVSRRALPRAAWIGTALLLTLLLAAQIVHSHSDWLTHVPFLGAKTSASNLSDYQLRQWGVTGDPAAKGTLRVRASILNGAAQLQPYPLLRVTLANRFGTRVGTREFEPTEYLGKPTARMLGPGEQVDATLDILDPGQDAESFEIDVCVRDADKKIVCTGDAAAQPR